MADLEDAIEDAIDFLAWQAGRWYLRHRLRRARRTLAMAGVVAAVVIGAVVAAQQRKPASN
jgi:hypothetical protein